MGKGSGRRPASVSEAELAERWSSTFSGEGQEGPAPRAVTVNGRGWDTIPSAQQTGSVAGGQAGPSGA